MSKCTHSYIAWQYTSHNVILNAFCIFFGIESTSYSITVNNTIMSTLPFSSSDTHKISITTTPKLYITGTTSLTHTTNNNNTTMQSSTGDNNTTTLIAAVISTVLILLVVSILVIIIVSVLMYKRRKRLTLKVSSREEVSHANIDTSNMRKDEGEKGRMSKNPSYQSKGIYIKEHVIINIRLDSNIV